MEAVSRRRHPQRHSAAETLFSPAARLQSRRSRVRERGGAALTAAAPQFVALIKLTAAFELVTEAGRDLIKQTSSIKLATRSIDETFYPSPSSGSRSHIRSGPTRAYIPSPQWPSTKAKQ